MDSKFFMFDTFLLDACLCSDDTTGELLCPLDIFRSAPGLASVVRGRGESDSVPNTASRLLETAGRLEEPLGLKKFELDNILSLIPTESFPTGLFCLDKLPAFMGPEFLLREGSAKDQPLGLPSSPPNCLSTLATTGGIPELGPAPSARAGGVAICDC